LISCPRSAWGGAAALLWLFSCNAGEIVVFQSDAGTSLSAGAGASSSGASSSGSDGVSGSSASSGAGNENGNSGDGGAPTNSSNHPCAENDDCDAGWFCETLSCADPEGRCARRPPGDDPSSAHVCGCDHVTYWNDTLRRQRGVAAILNEGYCQVGARPCGRDVDCGTGIKCTHSLQIMPNCSPQPDGWCWVIPSQCPSSSDGLQWLPCPPPDGSSPGSPPGCRSTCQALQARFPHFLVGPGLCP
jgi:hypothetical protein